MVHVHMYMCTPHIHVHEISILHVTTHVCSMYIYIHTYIHVCIPSLDVYILLLGPLSFIDNSPPPNVPSPNFFQTEKMAQNQCFHRNRVVKKNWQWGLGQHGLWHLPDIFSIAPRSFREGRLYSFFLQAVQ